jgi:hypothetical protein
MDIAKRLVKISKDSGGVCVYITSESKGYDVIYNTVSYKVSSFSSAELVALTRTFLAPNIGIPDGVAAYRKSGQYVLGSLRTFLLRTDAESFAIGNRVQYIYDTSTNTAIQITDYQPSLPGDGAVED